MPSIQQYNIQGYGSPSIVDFLTIDFSTTRHINLDSEECKMERIFYSLISNRIVDRAVVAMSGYSFYGRGSGRRESRLHATLHLPKFTYFYVNTKPKKSQVASRKS